MNSRNNVNYTGIYIYNIKEAFCYIIKIYSIKRLINYLTIDSLIYYIGFYLR
jgi:hypothetical protein